jgi:5,6-dimethylbenzimidazole synthase
MSVRVPNPAENLLDFYDVIFTRRDVRGQFTGEPVENEVLNRILGAAHAAPSVGLSQPWDFIIVKDHAIRQQFKDHVEKEREIFKNSLPQELIEKFAKIKIEGILDASLAVVVTYDDTRAAPHVLGRHSIKDCGLYSCCLAIENLWLAATYEGLGVGWVSFYKEEFLRTLLGIPDKIRPIAWLCLGPVTHFESSPDLERHNWRARLDLESVLHFENWATNLNDL